MNPLSTKQEVTMLCFIASVVNGVVAGVLVGAGVYVAWDVIAAPWRK